MQSEIFVPVTPKPVFTELKKPLSECKVAFITAGGIHKKDQKPFNTSGDFSYRTIPFDTPSDQLMVTHGGFDNSDINKDVNAMFPIDRLHELVKEGFIGSLPEETYTFMGGGGNVPVAGCELGQVLHEQRAWVRLPVHNLFPDVAAAAALAEVKERLLGVCFGFGINGNRVGRNREIAAESESVCHQPCLGHGVHDPQGEQRVIWDACQQSLAQAHGALVVRIPEHYPGLVAGGPRIVGQL